MTLETLSSQMGQTLTVVRALNSGASSANYQLSGHHSSWVLRFDIFRGIEDVLQDAAVLSAIRSAGVATHGDFAMFGMAADIPFSIRPFTEGTPLSELSELTREVSFDAGVELARFHSAASLSAVRPWFYSEAVQFPNQILTNSRDELALRARQLLSASTGQLRAAMYARDVLAHTDFKPNNLLVRMDGSLEIVDLEKATRASRCFDLGLSLFHFASDPRDDRAAANEIERLLLDGYKSAFPALRLDQALLRESTLFAASIFYLIDLEIESSERSAGEVDLRHAEYFREYCVPRFDRLLSRLT